MPRYCICDRGCGRGACIPQRDYDRQRTDPLTEGDLQEMILFSVGGKCGYPLADALKKRYTGLDGRDSKVFVGFKSSISIRLEVRSTHQKDPVTALNLVSSGYRTRNGQDRSVPAPILHRVVTDYPSRSER
jgi:hypothetical protein